MNRIVVTTLALIAILIVLTRVEYGFYSPKRGIASEGRDDVDTDSRARQLLTITVTAADVARLQGTVTLKSLSELYGTTDSLRCSVREHFKKDDLQLSTRRLEVGTQVTLCLN